FFGPLVGSYPDPNERVNGFYEGPSETIEDPLDSMEAIMVSHGYGKYYFEVFDDNSVDYSLSNAAVSIDLTKATQHGGFAEGDALHDIFEVTGSFFDDVIRGSNITLKDSVLTVDSSGNINAPYAYFTFFDSGNNVLIGGVGSDVLEGRGGADLLMGGSIDGDFDRDF